MKQQDEQSEDDERALFRRAMSDVVPLKASQRAQLPVRRTLSRARLARAALQPEGLPPGADLYEVQSGDELLFRRAGVPATVVRRLRRGQYRIEAETDLHGMMVTQATATLTRFIREAQAAGLRCVRVIHGKGLRSGTRGPVIKNTVNALLRQCEPVLAFASAQPVAGGTGATLVLLKQL